MVGVLPDSPLGSTCGESQASAPVPEILGAQRDDGDDRSDGSLRASLSCPVSANDSFTHIRAPILRGAHISKVVSNWGALLRTSPIDMPPAAQAHLWDKSKECKVLDAFISQSWNSPGGGGQKYAALLLRFYSRPACVVCFMTAFVCMALDGLSCLPSLEAFESERVGWDGKYGRLRQCPWSVVPSLASLAALLLAPYFHCMPERVVFFDALCINQSVDELKTEGINSLAGFLSNSKELIVLWEQSYFHRAWCAFELAVFVAIHGPSTVRFCPLFISTSLCFGYIMFVAACAVLMAAESAGVFSDLGITLWLLRALIVLVLPYLIHKLRRALVAVRDLAQQLERFNIDDVQCRLPEDLAFINESIRQLWGSRDRFNSFVRQELKATIGDVTSHFDYTHCLMMALPLAWYSIQSVIAYARAGMTSSDLLAAIVGHASIVFGLLPGLIKFAFELSLKFAGPFASLSTNISASICIALILAGYGKIASAIWIFTTTRFRFGYLLVLGLGILAYFVHFRAEGRRRICVRA